MIDPIRLSKPKSVEDIRLLTRPAYLSQNPLEIFAC
jgi:hypothetical protein